MIPLSITTIDVHPSTNVRSTQNEGWILRVEDDKLHQYDLKKLAERGKMGGLLRRKNQLVKHNAHKQEIKDWVARNNFVMPHGYFALWFCTPMPISWRPKKRAEMLYKAHQNTPDIDNYAKQVFDCIMPRRNRIAKEKGADDRKIHCYAPFKVWVPYEEACIRLVQYDPVEYMFQFEHGHPSKFISIIAKI